VSKNQTALTIEMWPIDKAIDYPKNARKWSKHAIAKVAASIKAYGFRQPVVVDKHGVIVIGHLRRTAARTLGLTEIPVHVARDLSEAQCRGLRLMDNRTALESTFDLDMLSAEFLELKALDFDLSLTGFDLREIDSFTLQPNAAEDDVPEVPIAPVSQLGDLWLMGDHRLLCGDSTNSEHVSRLLGERMPLLMVTDPPYGVEYDPDWRNRADRANGKSYGARAIGLVTNDDQNDWSITWKLFPGNVAYCWSPPGSNSIEHAIALRNSGFEIRTQIIWKKSHLIIGRGSYHYQHEPCWYAVRKGKPSKWNGDRTQSTIWEVPHQKSETGHSTQKPVEVMRRPIINHTVQGDSVYDPFLGSGTTLVAAELTGRICYGLEISPAYCDVIVTRWQNLTGKEATLDGHGCTFEHAKFGRRLGAQDALKEEAHGTA
jgi:DNA modification methylase